jgi:hypothetical protein
MKDFISGEWTPPGTEADELESIPVDNNDTWHLYHTDDFPIPAGTMSLCGIRARYTLEDGGDYGPMNPEEDRTCVICQRIADEINEAEQRDKDGYRDV